MHKRQLRRLIAVSAFLFVVRLTSAASAETVLLNLDTANSSVDVQVTVLGISGSTTIPFDGTALINLSADAPPTQVQIVSTSIEQSGGPAALSLVGTIPFVGSLNLTAVISDLLINVSSDPLAVGPTGVFDPTGSVGTLAGGLAEISGTANVIVIGSFVVDETVDFAAAPAEFTFPPGDGIVSVTEFTDSGGGVLVREVSVEIPINFPIVYPVAEGVDATITLTGRIVANGTQTVPEPSTLMLTLGSAAVAGLAFLRRRRRAV